MSENKLNGMTVAVLATNGFEESELLEPREALEHAGATLKVIAPKAGKIQGMKHDEKSKQIDADITLDKANPEEYDALFLPGACSMRTICALNQRRRHSRGASNGPESPSR